MKQDRRGFLGRLAALVAAPFVARAEPKAEPTYCSAGPMSLDQVRDHAFGNASCAVDETLTFKGWLRNQTVKVQHEVLGYESGPEAVLPLARNADGRLFVRVLPAELA